jgi:predicted transcriptional regulator
MLCCALLPPPPQVTSYTLPLREIDTVQGDDGPDGGYVPNALEVVVRKRHLGMLEVRQHPGGGGQGGC